MAFEDSGFDPIKYGALWERVRDMDKKIDKMELKVELLLELANKSKGGFWVGMTVASFVGAIAGWIVDHWKG